MLNAFTTNVKGNIDSRDVNMKGSGVTAQKIEPVISRFGPAYCSALLKMSEINLTFHKPLQKISKFRVAINNNCFHICGKNVITFKVP